MTHVSHKPQVLILILVLGCASAAQAQVATGIPPFSSTTASTFDTVDNANLNVHFGIPILSKAGRGIPFSYALSYDSSVWTPVLSGSTYIWTPVGQTTSMPTNWGWRGVTEAGAGYISYTTGIDYCLDESTQPYHEVAYSVYTSFTYNDPAGVAHSVGLNLYEAVPDCGLAGNTSGSALVNDGSGYTLSASISAGLTVTVYSAAGMTIVAPIGESSGSGWITDPNGNQSTATLSSNVTTFTDTLGTTALTVTAPGGGANSTYVYTGPNGNATYTVKYASYTVQTNFGCSTVTEFGATQEYLVSEIELPDGTNYAFTYEATPGYSGSVTGRLASVVLPTGGTISYDYTGGSNGITCADGSTATLERYTPDTGSNYWKYVHSETVSDWTTTLTDPQGNETVMYFRGLYETQRSVNQGSSPVLETVNTCYNGAAIPCTTTAITLPISSQTVQVTPSGGSPSQTTTTFNTYGLPTETDEYTYGPTLERKTLVSYDNGNSCGVTNTYVVNRACSVTVENNAGATAASTTNTYDANGDLLTQTVNTGGTPATLSRSFTPNNYGVDTAFTDYDGHSTNVTAFECGSGNTAFPASMTVGSLSYSLQWDCNGGVVTQVTDPNGQITGFKYDELWRLNETDYADGGQTKTTYNDTQGAFTVVTQSTVTSGASHEITYTLNGAGRVDEVQDNSAGTTVVTTYDSLGRVASVTNPYYTTSDPTYGTTQYFYDALNRLTGITRQDGSAVGISYSATCASRTDEAGKERTLCSDALGRITSVAEDPTGLNYQTTYSYDALNDLHVVTQGSETRTYSYDLLARLTQAITPESGTTSYSYGSGSSACSGNPRAVCSRTDARSTTTTYTYDTLNRLTGKTYSDGTPAASFNYDQSSVTIGSWTSPTLTNPKGRLTSALTSSAGTTQTGVVYSYDPMGRPSSYWQCTPANCGASSIWGVTYSYDLAGDVTGWTHPEGFTVTNTFSAAQQIQTITSSWSDSTHPPTLAQNMTYTPWGALSSLTNGCVGTGCTQTVESYTYNNRLQPTAMELGTASSAESYYALAYNYNWPSGQQMPNGCSLSSSSQGSGNNGNVMGYTYTDNQYSTLSHTALYAYDGVNRLACAQATGNVTYNLDFNYDAYGNMTCSTNSYTQGYCPQHSFSANNQISGYTYDAAGDMTSDGSYTYTYDAEQRMTEASNGPTTYAYNALGQRVVGDWSGTAVSFLFGKDADWLGGYWGSWASTVNQGGRPLVYEGSGPAEYMHVNALASSTMETTYSGAVASDTLFYPWGQLWQDPVLNNYQFAGTTWMDGNSATDFALNRMYRYNDGRWPNPDPAGLAAVDPTNPQTWNRYAYVTNNPTSFNDPLGLQGPNNPCTNLPYGRGGGMCLTDVNSVIAAELTLGPGTGWDPFDFISFWACPNGDCSYYDNLEAAIFAAQLQQGPSTAATASAANNVTSKQAATTYCQNHGQISFNVPFTKIPVTISLSATALFANFSSTNDISATPLPSFGASLDITIGAPNGPSIPVQVGSGKNLSIGTFLTPSGPKGFSGSIGPSAGSPVTVSPTIGNACGLMAGGG